jgi:hypothetical protein
MEWMELKEGCVCECVCWLVMAGSAGEKPWAAEEEEEVEGGHPELLPLLLFLRSRAELDQSSDWPILLEGVAFSSTEDDVITMETFGGWSIRWGNSVNQSAVC